MRSTRNRGKLLSIDWDARRLRLVEAVMRKGGVDIAQMHSIDIPPEIDMSNPETVGALLKKLLSQSGIRTKRVILDVPRDQVLLTTLRLPAASPDEMPALVEFQVAKELPFSLSEAVVDFAAADNVGDDGRVDVLVGTVRREVVAYYEKACVAAGLTLERLGLRPYANKVAIGELHGGADVGSTMMVDVGPRLTEIDLIADGKLAFSRAASVVVGPMTPMGDDSAAPGQADGDGPSQSESSIIRFPNAADASDPIDRVVESLLVEVTRSLAAYRAQAEGGRELQRIVVGGDVGVEARLAEALHKRMDVPVDLYNPARQFGWPDERGREARAFAAALGLVCGHADVGRLHFDFLHPKKTVTVVERRLRKAPAVAAVVVLFTVAVITYYIMTVSPVKREIAELETEIDDVKDRIDDLEKYKKRVIDPVVAFENGQVVWIDELNNLTALLPDNKEALLTRLDMYQKNGRITLPIECKRSEVAMETVAKIDAFRRAGSEDTVYDASAKTFTTKSGAYPSSGTIEVLVEGAPDD